MYKNLQMPVPRQLFSCNFSNVGKCHREFAGREKGGLVYDDHFVLQHLTPYVTITNTPVWPLVEKKFTNLVYNDKSESSLPMVLLETLKM